MLGEVKEYNIKNSSFESSNGVAEITLTVDTDYSLGASMEEVYTFLTIDDGVYMTGIDLPKEEVTDDVASAFFSALGDPESMLALYIPMVKDADVEENLNTLCERLANAGGEYVGYTLDDQQFCYRNLGESDAVFVYAGTYTLEYSGMDAVCVLQMSVEDEQLGLNNVEITPSVVLELCEGYYAAMSQKDVEHAADFYSQVFFDQTSGGRSAWTEIFLSPIFSNYGAFLSYDIAEWDVRRTELPSGEYVDTISVRVYSDYEDMSLEELILLNCDENGCEILAHQVNELG